MGLMIPTEHVSDQKILNCVVKFKQIGYFPLNFIVIVLAKINLSSWW